MTVYACVFVDEKERAMSVGFKVSLGLILVAFTLAVMLFRPNELENGEKRSLYEMLVVLWSSEAPDAVTSWVITDVAPMEKDAAPTASELEMKAELEKKLSARAPTYRLSRAGSNPMEGELLEETADFIVFGQKYGNSADIRVKIPRTEVVQLEKLPLPDLPEITIRDVRFHEKFPDLFFFKAVPYTVVSQESYFSVQRMIQEQQRLYYEFISRFGALITSSTALSDIQILVFSDRELYDVYMAEQAPDFKGFSGVYVPREKRLITYHQRDSKWVEDNSKQIDAVAKQYRDKHLDGRNSERLRQWQVSEKDRLHGAAQQATERTLRHEGAHQLFFTLGVQNSFQQGRIWVTEGLATFCETEKIGWANSERIQSLQEAVAQNRLSSLTEIVSKTKLLDAQAYAEVWSLVHLLMQPEYQPQFFDYLRWLRESSQKPSQDPVGELAGFMKMDVAQLESRWKASVEQWIRSIKGR